VTNQQKQHAEFPKLFASCDKVRNAVQ